MHDRCRKPGLAGQSPGRLDGLGQAATRNGVPPSNEKPPEKPGVSFNLAENQGDSLEWAEPGLNRRHMDFQSIAANAQAPDRSKLYGFLSKYLASFLSFVQADLDRLESAIDECPLLGRLTLDEFVAVSKEGNRRAAALPLQSAGEVKP